MTEEEVKKYINKCVRLYFRGGHMDSYIIKVKDDICIAYRPLEDNVLPVRIEPVRIPGRVSVRIPIIHLLDIKELSKTESILFKLRYNI